MQRTVTAVEKDVIPIPRVPVVCPAGIATEVLESLVNVRGEFMMRQVFNNGSDAYYAFGYAASPTMYNGIVVTGQLLDCSNHALSVSLYSVAGTTAAITLIQRTENNTQRTFVN